MAADALVSLGCCNCRCYYLYRLVLAGCSDEYYYCFGDSLRNVGLFTQSLKLALDGVPEGVDFNKLKEEILAIDGVKDFKHLHIWALSTTENALTAHLQVEKSLSQMKLKS